MVGTALTTRLAYLFVGTSPGDAPSDSGQYHEIASNLAHGDGFASTFPQLSVHATAFRPPVYPLLLGALYRVTGPSIVAGKLLNVMIGLAVVVLATRLVLHTVNRTAGWVAGALLAVYPPLIANDVNLLTEPVSLLVLVLLATEVAGRSRWWLLGLETGVLVLTRPSAQLFVLVVAVFLLQRVGLRRTLAFGALVVVCTMPWLARNHVQVHTWTMYTSNGFNVAAMYSRPAQDSHSFIDPTQDPRFQQFRFSQFDETAWDGEMTRVGLDGIRANPRYVAFNVGRNAAAELELWPALNTPAEQDDGRNMTVRLVGLPLFFVITGLGCWGLLRGRRIVAVRFLGVSGVYFVLASLILVAPPRLRAPFDLACCIGAAVVVAAWWDRRTASSSTTPVPVAHPELV